MRYGRLIMALPEEEVFSVDRLLEHAFAHGLLPENETDDLTVVRRRAFDALSKFAKKHLDKEVDERVINRNRQFIPGWYGWRWKLALPTAFFEDTAELERLRALEEAWLDQNLVGFAPDDLDVLVKQSDGSTEPDPEPDEEPASREQVTDMVGEPASQSASIHGSSGKARPRRVRGVLIRFAPGLLCGMALFFLLPRLDAYRQKLHALEIGEEIDVMVRDVGGPGKAAYEQLSVAMLLSENQQERVLFFRALLMVGNRDTDSEEEQPAAPIRYNGLQSNFPNR